MLEAPNEKQFLDKEIAQQIIGSAFEVSNHLGHGYLEKVYQRRCKLNPCPSVFICGENLLICGEKELMKLCGLHSSARVRDENSSRCCFGSLCVMGSTIRGTAGGGRSSVDAH
jgi:hypothetical protein